MPSWPLLSGPKIDSRASLASSFIFPQMCARLDPLRIRKSIQGRRLTLACTFAAPSRQELSGLILAPSLPFVYFICLRTNNIYDYKTMAQL